MPAPPQKRELLPEQAAAAYEIKKHISVTAGPGSGKTMVLVERYLHILREHKLNIDQIVAITFTNRAANEMRERLRAQLNQILQTASDQDRRHWLGYKRTLDGAVITTIHGFCARLLREFPVEARIDPQFLLLDEHRAAMLLESVVEEVLREFIVSGHVEISRLTLGVGRGKLADTLTQLYREVRGQGLSLKALSNKTAGSHSTEDDYQAALQDLDKCIAQILSRRGLSVKAASKRNNFAQQWPALREMLETIPAYDAVGDYCAAIERLRLFRPDKTAVGDLAGELDDFLWGNVSKRPNDYSGLVPRVCFDIFAQQYALELTNVLTRIDERLNEEKQKLSALDFDDLELRTLELLEHPAVLTRAAERYKFFLVDEFQDTNSVQRQLLERLALRKGRRESANLFIVGDRKQSIYGFRGADVDVFREMTKTLVAAGGEPKKLLLNFRSQPPLIHFFNYLFAQLFQPAEGVTEQEREELGYVTHEPGEPKRELRDSGPLVELLITAEATREADDPKADQDSRQLDAEQLARRISALTGHEPALPGSAGVPPALSNDTIQDKDETINSDRKLTLVGGRDARAPSEKRRTIPTVAYSDIALLFRAMTHVQVYESVFRRANIPYQTVLGRGFYQREEITDLIQLLRFLDNKTDELALAAVLRSPLCGLSDNALLALRCGPLLTEVDTDPLRHFQQTRRLLNALRKHDDIALISEEEHQFLDRAANLINELIARRHHYALGDLLRFAVERSEYLTIIAANFDGAQRLANVQRLFTLAERFDRSGTHLIRDFVRYVEEFEAIGSRESEGQIDEAANAVRLMTIHQAKGLEFPIVIIPELQRHSRVTDKWFLLDRHRGLTLKVPDGRGKSAAGGTFSSFEQRQNWREQFESMRLLYVAATRAQDRLIFSGTAKDFTSLGGKGDTWLNWIWKSLGLETQTRSGLIDLTDEAQLQLTLNLADSPAARNAIDDNAAEYPIEADASLSQAFPLIAPVHSDDARGVHRFSVTQLINYQRCPRQYYFDRVLHVPAPDAIAVWNDAEAPEPPANLTATLKGAVIHRFCETFESGDDPDERLRRSFADVVGRRRVELVDRLVDIDTDKAIKDLLPLAENYLASPLFQRVEAARGAAAVTSATPENTTGLWSELSFRLRRPLGILTGAIDKLLITQASDGQFEIEIIDFKTNRLAVNNKAGSRKEAARILGPRASRPQSAAGAKARTRSSTNNPSHQIAFDFNAPVQPEPGNDPDSIDEAAQRLAADYQLQMQAYALAAHQLVPAIERIKVTLHFLDPNIEFHLSDELLDPAACAHAIDDAMRAIISSSGPEQFPVHPATHCRMCNFLDLCGPGRQGFRDAKR
jgi:ATP-dependent helicase/nuclease subunit A